MTLAKRVGVVELIASTAAVHNKLRPTFWIELAVKRQLYSVMPQAVSVWARRKGCETFYATYLGLGRLETLPPKDLDILFISTPTQHCVLAYALAGIFRRHGVRVVLAGSHARAFPQDCARFADLVVTDCDSTLVEEILTQEFPKGTILQSARPLTDLPMIEEREPEIRAAAYVNGRQVRTTAISLLASLGCPYACDFCSEWKTSYSAFDASRLRRELEVAATRYPGALIGFHDPNFGVKFDQTLEAFEGRELPRRNPFVMEASLSLLSSDRLKRLSNAGCLMVAPGIESWADYSNKSRTTRIQGEAKYIAISQKMLEIENYIPTAQANIILGVDADAGDEPFELTERFIREHPKVWTNVNIPIPFGETPFAQRVQNERRLVAGLPFAFYTAPYMAMRPSNYELADYLRRLIRIYETLVSPTLTSKRLRAYPTWLTLGIVLARTAALRVELSELRKFSRAMDTDREVRRFYEGETEKLPAFFKKRLRDRCGRYIDLLPGEALRPWSQACQPERPTTIV